MKEKTKLQKIARTMLDIANKEKLTPEQLRYVFKKVRELGHYQVPKAKRKLPDFLSPAEIYHIRSVIQEKFRPVDLFMFEFLLGTGLRVGEFVRLLVTDLDFGNNVIKVPVQTKTGNRYVPFSQGLQGKCKLFIKGKLRGYLISKSNNKPYTERGIQKRFEKIFKTAGLTKNLHTHSIRHTYATVLRANGVSIQDIQKYLGHSSYKTTEIYAHLVYDMDQQKQIMQIIDNA